MPLVSGTQLGSYEILAPLGAGGMGEVYRASDTKLKREVALKVLPELFANDAQRMARFEREAQLLASLNHPNIAHIHGLEESNAVRALVIELVEGPALAERIAQGPIPLEEVLPFAKQIAEALEYAHDKGIIHRDLKPANIKLTHDGQVKVLDFGLAKALEGDPLEANLSTSPTISAAATRAGMLLGTAAYMSPEQAKGKPVDRRADIWAYGCVLYEMLAGKPAFSGETVTDTLAAVVRGEPEWSQLPEKIPGRIRELLHRCLVKDQKHRLQAIGEARIVLDKYLADPSAESAVVGGSAIESLPAWQPTLPWVIAAIFIFAFAFVLWSPWKTPKTELPMRLSIELGAETSLPARLGSSIVLSPDGSKLAFVGRGADQKERIYLRQLDQLNATVLPGTEDASSIFFSPDGQWIAFFADEKLKKVAVQGGAATVLCNAPDPRGGTWTEDGTIVFAMSLAGGLFRVSSAGGASQPLTSLDKEKGDVTHRWPQTLPGGKAILFLAHGRRSNYQDARILVYSLKSGASKEILAGGYYPRYLPSGHLAYVHEGTLFAVPFDLDRLQMTGQPAPILEEVHSNPGVGSAQYSFSETGSLIYRPGKAVAGNLTVSWLEAQGKFRPLRNVPAVYLFPRFSPDGKRLAVMTINSSNTDVWIYEWARDTMTRFTFDPAEDAAPVWTPDGQRLAFRSDRSGNTRNIYWQRADGTGPVERLTVSKNGQTPFSWSPDGKLLAFEELSPDTKADIMILPMEGDERSGWKPEKPQVFLNTPANESAPAFSPDGRWLAYHSDESGKNEVYVRPFPGPAGKWQISTDGGSFPKWSPNGKELFYKNAENRIMVSSYTVAGNSFRPDKPRLWSEAQMADLSNLSFDLHPDGKRFAVVTAPEDTTGTGTQKVTLILNFSEELRRLPSSKK